MYFIFSKWAQILTFYTKSSQIARTFHGCFHLQTFGLVYSPLNSATLSCLSEVTLFYINQAFMLHLCTLHQQVSIWEEESLSSGVSSHKINRYLFIRCHSRIFVKVGHQITSIENHIFLLYFDPKLFFRVESQ